jgi:hypothetical protein
MKTYVERHWFSTRCFTLDGPRLCIWIPDKRGSDIAFDLANIQPEPKRQVIMNVGGLRRSTTFLVVLLCLGSLCIRLWPAGQTVISVLLVLLGSAPTIVIFACLFPVHLARFHDVNGRTAFDLVEGKRRTTELSAFLEELEKAICEAQSSRPNKPLQPTATAVMPPANAGDHASRSRG